MISEKGINSSGLRLVDITKKYGDYIAVKKISLLVEEGKFLTLLGPSGCGKTTTLLVMAGFLTANEGDVFIGDRCITNVPPQKRDLGMVFQNYALFPHMTIFDNISFPLKIRKIKKDEISMRVKEMLDIIKLSGYENRYPRQLSGGQQQRVALARALIASPRVLLMDEPLGALDKQLREQMQLEIKHLQQKLNITVVYVTHDQTEALTMSDVIVVMNNGIIEQVGTPKELYNSPKTEFVADFLGESNFLYGKISSKIRKEVIVNTDSGLQVVVKNDSTRGISDNTTICLRPEKIDIGSGADLLENNYTGIVRDVLFLGDAIKYKVEVMDNEIITVKIQASKTAVIYQVGESVVLGWNSSDAVLL